MVNPILGDGSACAPAKKTLINELRAVISTNPGITQGELMAKGIVKDVSIRSLLRHLRTSGAIRKVGTGKDSKLFVGRDETMKVHECRVSTAVATSIFRTDAPVVPPFDRPFPCSVRNDCLTDDRRHRRGPRLLVNLDAVRDRLQRLGMTPGIVMPGFRTLPEETELQTQYFQILGRMGMDQPLSTCRGVFFGDMKRLSERCGVPEYAIQELVKRGLILTSRAAANSRFLDGHMYEVSVKIEAPPFALPRGAQEVLRIVSKTPVYVVKALVLSDILSDHVVKTKLQRLDMIGFDPRRILEQAPYRDWTQEERGCYLTLMCVLHTAATPGVECGDEEAVARKAGIPVLVMRKFVAQKAVFRYVADEEGIFRSHVQSMSAMVAEGMESQVNFSIKAGEPGPCIADGRFFAQQALIAATEEFKRKKEIRETGGQTDLLSVLGFPGRSISIAPGCPTAQVIDEYAAAFKTRRPPMTKGGPLEKLIGRTWSRLSLAVGHPYGGYTDAREGLRKWREMLLWFSESEFLRNGLQGFRPTLPWMLEEANFERIMCGTYHGSARTRTANTTESVVRNYQEAQEIFMRRGEMTG